jgi:hypothetical protein
VVLSARAETLPHLGRRLLELAELRIELQPWNLTETGEYLHKALLKSGRTSPTFDALALERMYELTGGVPRGVQQIANLAVLAAIGSRTSTIDLHMLETVVSELSVTTGSGAGGAHRGPGYAMSGLSTTAEISLGKSTEIELGSGERMASAASQRFEHASPTSPQVARWDWASKTSDAV